MERINPPELNKPLGPYCQVTRATNMVFFRSPDIRSRVSR